MDLSSRISAPASAAAVRDFDSYASALGTSIAGLDGRTAANLLELGDLSTLSQRYAYLSNHRAEDAPFLNEFMRAFRNVDYNSAGGQSPWSGIASRHIAAVLYLSNTQSPAWERAYAAQLELVKYFIPWFQDNRLGLNGWSLPVLYTITRDLKNLAVEADKALLRSGGKALKLEEASRLITKGWTACLIDGTLPQNGQLPLSKGTYYLATLLFKIYFRLETLGLCKNIVRAIDNQARSIPLESFPMSHQVTYRYYLGIFAFLNERYADAESHFDFSFAHCHRRAYRNQERILSYLIPLRMLRGVLPAKHLLDNFPRLKAVYGPFASAYRIGDLKSFDDALIENRGLLVKRGSFLIIERSREGCLRQLFKKVWLCSGKGSRMLVSTVQQALKHVSVDVDSDEVECLLANLIYKGHMKGYISHERQTVVLAKEKPFPDLVGKALTA